MKSKRTIVAFARGICSLSENCLTMSGKTNGKIRLRSNCVFVFHDLLPLPPFRHRASKDLPTDLLVGVPKGNGEAPRADGFRKVEASLPNSGFPLRGDLLVSEEEGIYQSLGEVRHL